MQKLYVIYDSKSETYSAPTANPARGQAIRAFSDGVNGGQGVLADHPGDFTMFEIGTFDPQTGEINLYEAKETVANGLDLKVDEDPSLAA